MAFKGNFKNKLNNEKLPIQDDSINKNDIKIKEE